MSNTDNKSTITTVTSTLCVLAFLAVAAVCVLAYLQCQIPPELNTLAGGLVGALTAMLVKTSPTAAVPETKIVNPPDDPAHVTVEPHQKS